MSPSADFTPTTSASVELTLDTLLHSNRSPHKPAPRPCAGVRLPDGQVRYANGHEQTILSHPAPIVRCGACRAVNQKVTVFLAKSRKEIGRLQSINATAESIAKYVDTVQGRLSDLVAAECAS